MARCSFCGQQITPGTGLMYVKKDGKILHFCSSKCKKNTLVLRRKAIRLKWTKHYIKAQ